MRTNTACNPDVVLLSKPGSAWLEGTPAMDRDGPVSQIFFNLRVVIKGVTLARGVVSHRLDLLKGILGT